MFDDVVVDAEEVEHDAAPSGTKPVPVCSTGGTGPREKSSTTSFSACGCQILVANLDQHRSCDDLTASSRPHHSVRRPSPRATLSMWCVQPLTSCGTLRYIPLLGSLGRRETPPRRGLCMSAPFTRSWACGSYVPQRRQAHQGTGMLRRRYSEAGGRRSPRSPGYAWSSGGGSRHRP